MITEEMVRKMVEGKEDATVIAAIAMGPPVPDNCPVCSEPFDDFSRAPACTVVPESIENKHCFFPIESGMLGVFHHEMREEEKVEEIEEEGVSIDIE